MYTKYIMERTIDIELIKKKKIMIGTPMYGGNATVGYVESLINLIKICAIYNVEIDYLFLWNESLITRGRNGIADDFLKTDYDYLFFIDADISFNALDFLYMVELAAKDKEKQIICGAYPKKIINWDFIKKAEETGHIKNSKDYLNYQSEYVVNVVSSDKNEIVFFDLEKPLKVHQSGTGFMLIAREVFYKFKENYPEQKYIDEKTKKEMVAFFDCKINPETNFYMSEDWMFCYYASKILIPTWVLPWVSLNHFGSYNFTGNFKEHSRKYEEILNFNKN